jgi:hypothetical protein
VPEHEEAISIEVDRAGATDLDLVGPDGHRLDPFPATAARPPQPLTRRPAGAPAHSSAGSRAA